jgi:hypothetical protein
MKQSEYLRRLEAALEQRLGPEETADVLRDQRELIADAVAQGQTEQEAVARMGDPEALAQELAGAPRQMEQASLGRRLAAYALDTLPVVLAALMGLLLFQAGGVTGISTLTGGVDAPGEDGPIVEQKLEYDRDGQLASMTLTVDGEIIFLQRYPDRAEADKALANRGLSLEDIDVTTEVRPMELMRWDVPWALAGLWLMAGFLALGVSGLFTGLVSGLAGGYTLGRWALGIRVAGRDGERPGLGRCLLRDTVILCVAGCLSGGIVNLISLCMAGSGQGLHDRAAGTVVIRVPRRARR